MKMLEYFFRKLRILQDFLLYKEAFKMETEEEVLFPIYDSQEKAYNTILDKFKVASDMFQEGSGAIVEGDLIFDGDITKI